MKILITGVTGQDGRYLADYLLGEGNEVTGTCRPRTQNFPDMDERIELKYVDMTDHQSMSDLMRTQYDEIYNLAAQSHVGESFANAAYTMAVNAIGACNMLELAGDTPLYQASTSEMFGDMTDEDGRISEATRMVPNSPYGAAKLAAHNMVRINRLAHGKPQVSGILFNHESPLRGNYFLTKKVSDYVSGGDKKPLHLGNLDAARDWGYAPEYVVAMVEMLRAQRGDYVVATGTCHTVREWIEVCFQAVGEKLEWRDNFGFVGGICRIIGEDKVHKRPLDINRLCGNPELIQSDLHWRAKTTLFEMAQNMVNKETRKVA